MNTEVEKKPVATKTFEEVGEAMVVEIEQEGRPNKEVTFQFGHLVTRKEGDDDKIAGRFRASLSVVVDGVSNVVDGMSTNASKALGVALKAANLGGVDDWTFDLEHEFFEQKYAAPKEDTDDFWKNKAFTEIREDVMELRNLAEAKAEQMVEAKEDAQQESIDFAVLLRKMYDAVGSKMKVLQSVLTGPGGEGDNHPRLAKLGKGVNAVREAMKFADLTAAQNSVLPSSIVSGKALDGHKGRALTAICKDVNGVHNIEWPEDLKTKNEVRLPDLASLGVLVRDMCKRSFGVELAMTEDLTLSEVLGEAQANGVEKIAEYSVSLGKEANTYDKDEYAAALMAYGRVLCIDDDGGLLNALVNDMHTLADKVTGPDRNADDLVNGLREMYNRNLLAKRLIDVAWAHKTETEKFKQNRQLLDETTDEDSPISATAAKKLAALTPDQQAAYMVQMIARLPLPGTVFAKVKQLGAQLGLEDPKAVETQEAAE